MEWSACRHGELRIRIKRVAYLGHVHYPSSAHEFASSDGCRAGVRVRERRKYSTGATEMRARPQNTVGTHPITEDRGQRTSGPGRHEKPLGPRKQEAGSRKHLDFVGSQSGSQSPHTHTHTHTRTHRRFRRHIRACQLAPVNLHLPTYSCFSGRESVAGHRHECERVRCLVQARGCAFLLRRRVKKLGLSYGETCDKLWTRDVTSVGSRMRGCRV